MDQILSFVRERRELLWFVLATGVCSLYFSTFGYRTTRAWTAKLTRLMSRGRRVRSSRSFAEGDLATFWNRSQRWWRRMNRTVGMRVVWVLESLLLIGLAIAGLVLL